MPSSFYDRSLTLPGTVITSYAWDFGDGQQSSAANPQHTYTAPGTYAVSLTIAFATCTEVKMHQVTIPGASVSFSLAPSPTCALTPVTFSLVNNGTAPLAGWLWEFGDGVSSQHPAPARAYAAAGNYLAKLTVTDIRGCMDSAMQSVTVTPAPSPASVTPPGPLAPCANDLPVLTAPPGVSYWWNDSTALQTLVPTATGNYFVVVTDADHCRYATPPVQVAVTEPPASGIRGIYEVCAGKTVILSATPGTGLQNTWYRLPADTVVSTSGTLSFPWNTQPGTYPVYLVQEDTLSGCQDTSAVLPVVIHPLPAAPTLVSSPTGMPCAHPDVLLEVTNPQANTGYLWSTGNFTAYGGTANPQITVGHAGLYWVYAVDDMGCTKSSNNINVAQPTGLGGIVTGCYTLCDTLPKVLAGANCIGNPQWLNVSGPAPVVVATTNSFQVSQPGQYVYVCHTPSCSDTSEVIDITIRHCCPVDPPAPQIFLSNDTLFASTVPGNFAYQWLQNGQALPGATFPLLAMPPDGCYTLLLTDTNGCSALSNTLCFITTGMVSAGLPEGIFVYPNPASQTVTFSGPATQAVLLIIWNAEGRQVMVRRFSGSAGVDVSSFEPGLYSFSMGGRRGKIVVVR
jgi:PKD repeat protein